MILVQQRLGLISGYLKDLKKLASLPRDEFLSDSLKVAAAESFLRRSLEAIFDVGRHVLAKSGFVELAAEYKSITGARCISRRGFRCVLRPHRCEKHRWMSDRGHFGASVLRKAPVDER